MESVTITLKYCYGISQLEHKFDFSNDNMPIALYAPNGMMKTSLAKSFHDYINGDTPKDEIHEDRVSVFKALDEMGNELEPDNIFVVDSINEKYISQKISTLLASEELKASYDSIFNEIARKQETLVKKLKALSGLTKDIDQILMHDFSAKSAGFLTALGRLEREVKSEKYAGYANFKYKTLFNEKVLKFVSNPNFESVIAEYTKVYDQLLDRSRYFKKGIFNHTNAETIAKTLKSNGWFDGGHSVNLSDGSIDTEIKDEPALVAAIDQEKNTILTDPKLKEMFLKVDKAVSNVELKAFREYLLDNPSLVPELTEIDSLKTKIWMGYLTKHKETYLELVSAYDASEKKLKSIIGKAEVEQTRWESVIDIFNERFSVPFEVTIENKGDAVLNINSPQIAFYFKDSENNRTKVSRNLLDRVLSNGEKRALYILNIVFEVEARRKGEVETLFLIDDIADSFDYKNKYAIVEYLDEMKEEKFFHLVLLTHNFDFYRTVRGRLGIYGDNKLIASKAEDQIYLNVDGKTFNPFMDWLSKLGQAEYMIAAIPFIRNIAEYIGDKEAFEELTSLLHIKEKSSSISFKNLSNLYTQIIPNLTGMVSKSDSVIDAIFTIGDQILGDASEGVQLEKKIVLSIAIRLKAEKVMIKEIDDNEFVRSITRSQTARLVKKYSKLENVNENARKVIRQVGLMTPENIHLNSFMFEPILDISIHHLKKLYFDVSSI